MSLDVMETVALSDDQIERLLQEAETRLRANNGTVATIEPENELTLRLDEDKPEFVKRKPIPRLQHGLNEKSYLKEQDGVAMVVPELLATKDQQTLADNLRSIDYKDKQKSDVSAALYLSYPPSYEENYPKFLLTQTSISF